jgi:2-keto-4-pentenoate hydratase/2-oxohepta-3-ene-1,7-dioic acid hydratase in catechol pathway
VAGTGKFICIGLNYSDHAAETGSTVPPEPIIFMKATSAICGPNDPIVIPRGSEKTDWEVELAVIIGSRAKYVSEAEALTHVAGYAVANDVSERAFQIERAGQWTKGKSCDNFGQIGPWLVTRDEVPDPQDLALWLKVNGKTCQNGSTRTMVYGVAYLVSYLSQFMTLHPGDVISTGTPPGVGLGRVVSGPVGFVCRMALRLLIGGVRRRVIRGRLRLGLNRDSAAMGFAAVGGIGWWRCAALAWGMALLAQGAGAAAAVGGSAAGLSGASGLSGVGHLLWRARFDQCHP